MKCRRFSSGKSLSNIQYKINSNMLYLYIFSALLFLLLNQCIGLNNILCNRQIIFSSLENPTYIPNVLTIWHLENSFIFYTKGHKSSLNFPFLLLAVIFCSFVLIYFHLTKFIFSFNPCSKVMTRLNIAGFKLNELFLNSLF